MALLVAGLGPLVRQQIMRSHAFCLIILCMLVWMTVQYPLRLGLIPYHGCRERWSEIFLEVLARTEISTRQSQAGQASRYHARASVCVNDPFAVGLLTRHKRINGLMTTDRI